MCDSCGPKNISTHLKMLFEKKIPTKHLSYPWEKPKTKNIQGGV